MTLFHHLVGGLSHFAYCSLCKKWEHDQVRFRGELPDADRWQSLSEGERKVEIGCHRYCRVAPVGNTPNSGETVKSPTTACSTVSEFVLQHKQQHESRFRVEVVTL